MVAMVLLRLGLMKRNIEIGGCGGSWEISGAVNLPTFHHLWKVMSGGN